MKEEPAPAVSHVPAARQVERGIIRGLYDGSFAPGQRLVEPDLIKRFGVGRSTVREAIMRLESFGVVDVLPFRGAQIRQLSPQEAWNVLKVVEYCTGLAARQAAERIGEAKNLNIFRTALDDLRKFRHLPDGFEQIRARNRFYAAISRISGNRELQRIIPRLQVHLVRSLYPIPQDERFDDYEAMAEAIMSGDGERAERTVRAHITRTMERIPKPA